MQSLVKTLLLDKFASNLIIFAALFHLAHERVFLIHQCIDPEAHVHLLIFFLFQITPKENLQIADPDTILLLREERIFDSLPAEPNVAHITDQTCQAELQSILPNRQYWVRLAQQGDLEKINAMLTCYTWPNHARLICVLTFDNHALLRAAIASKNLTLMHSIMASYKQLRDQALYETVKHLLPEASSDLNKTMVTACSFFQKPIQTEFQSLLQSIDVPQQNINMPAQN